MAAEILEYIEASERMVGAEHATRPDTLNRALRDMLTKSGYDPDAEFAGLLGPVFNVRAYGAVGDGATDDTVALQAAIAAAEDAALSAGVGGAVVWLGQGRFAVSADIDIPDGVTLKGVGPRGSRIEWNSDDPPTVAVVTSNLDGSFGHGIRIEGVRVEATGEAVAMKLCGWNENCGLDQVEVAEFTGKGLWLDATAGGQITQNTTFRQIRSIPHADAASAVGFYFKDVRRCNFYSLTCDKASGATAPTLIGAQLYSGCQNNMFVGANMEDCTIGWDVGAGGNSEGNEWFSLIFFAPHATPADTTVGSYTGTMCIVIRAGVKSYAFHGVRDGQRYDYLLVDTDRAKAILSDGQGSSTFTLYQHIIASRGWKAGGNGGDVFLTDDEHLGTRFIGGVVEINTTTTNVDVTFAESINVSTSGGDVQISGLAGGRAGQRVTIFKTTSANKLTLLHNSGSATQPFILPNAVDWTGRAHGGITLEYNGTQWFVVGQSAQRSSLSVNSDQTALDVSGVSVIKVTTTGGTVNLYGFANGVDGQAIDIIKVTSANSLVIQHNDASGTQKLISPTGADLTLTSFGGIRLVFNGTSWFPTMN